MKSVLLGIDFLNLDGQLKFLEINTDTYIPHVSFDSFDFDALEAFLVQNNYTNFRVIYKTENTASEFIEKLQSICTTHNINFIPVTVPIDAITVPMFDDADTDFTLRISYDITATIDDVYCRDKKELLSLIFNGNQTDLIPKTYFKKDTNTFDNLSDLIDNGIHPNLIIKKTLPDFEKTQYPEFYKVASNDDLNTIKSAMDVDLVAQEFDYNSNNLYMGKIRDHIRYWIILCSDAETMVDFGGYISPNALPLDSQYVSYTDNKLDTNSRILYFSNPARVGSGVPGIYETTKYVDGQEVVIPISDIQLGDTVKGVQLPGFVSEGTSTAYAIDYNYTGSYTDITYTTASVLVVSNDNLNEWFIKVNYSIATDEYSMLVNLVELLLTSDTDGNNVTFKVASELTANDTLVISNDTLATVNSIGYEMYSGSVVKINVEPTDVFVAGSTTNGIGNTIANNFIIYNYKS